MFKKPSMNGQDIQMTLMPDFIDAKDFINKERYKAYGDESYEKIRIQLLQDMLKNRNKK